MITHARLWAVLARLVPVRHLFRNSPPSRCVRLYKKSEVENMYVCVCECIHEI